MSWLFNKLVNIYTTDVSWFHLEQFLQHTLENPSPFVTVPMSSFIYHSTTQKYFHITKNPYLDLTAL